MFFFVCFFLHWSFCFLYHSKYRIVDFISYIIILSDIYTVTSLLNTDMCVCVRAQAAVKVMRRVAGSFVIQTVISSSLEIFLTTSTRASWKTSSWVRTLTFDPGECLPAASRRSVSVSVWERAGDADQHQRRRRASAQLRFRGVRRLGAGAGHSGSQGVCVHLDC